MLLIDKGCCTLYKSKLLVRPFTGQPSAGAKVIREDENGAGGKNLYQNNIDQ